MINYINGNILDTQCDAIVNPVNCYGVMGAGLAYQVKNKFYDCYLEYKHYCDCGHMRPGGVFATSTDLVKPRKIFHMATKDHWKNPSRITWIDEGLRNLKTEIEIHWIDSIALPAIGCGLGGLEWELVKAKIEQHLVDTIDVDVYLPERSI